jgi:hypothetical protein
MELEEIKSSWARSEGLAHAAMVGPWLMSRAKGGTRLATEGINKNDVRWHYNT